MSFLLRVPLVCNNLGHVAQVHRIHVAEQVQRATAIRGTSTSVSQYIVLLGPLRVVVLYLPTLEAGTP